MELISVIVPVYKVEPYLDRCVQSIVDQTYRNLEIILVDDGSPDRCGAICDAWAAKDDRITVIHKKNGGLSDARNAGMAIASGDYLGFVDSDDHIAPEMYQLLMNQIRLNESDIAACGVEVVFEDGSPSRMLTKAGTRVLSTQEAMLAILDESWLKQPVWYKLYKTELIRDIPFPVGKYHEDVFWSYQAIARANKVSVTDTPCYFYVQRFSSIMGTKYSLKRLDALEAKEQRLHYIMKHYPALLSAARIDLWQTCLYQGQMSLLYLQKKDRKTAFSLLHDCLTKHPLLPEDLHGLPLKKQIWFRLARHSFPSSCRLRNLLKRGL